MAKTVKYKSGGSVATKAKSGKTEPAASLEGKEGSCNNEGDMAKVCHDYEKLCSQCVAMENKLNKLQSSVKTFEMLLAAFNALTEKGIVKLEKPENKTPYWYIRAMPTVRSFDVVSAVWNDNTSDRYRYVKGNMYLEESVANKVKIALNEMLLKLDY